MKKRDYSNIIVGSDRYNHLNATNKLIILFELYKDMICFMGYKAYSYKDFSYHHIIKECDGGPKTIDNGAIVIHAPHMYLNEIEKREYDIYLEINRIFKEINTQREKPTKEQYLKMNKLLKQFERCHSKDLDSKEKPVIKPVYLQRLYYFNS